MVFGDKGIVGARILYRIAVTAGVPIAAFRSRGERFPAGRSYGLA